MSFSCYVSFSFDALTCLFVVPHGPPLDCSVVNYNSSSFQVSMRPPERLLINGIIHYEIDIINDYDEELHRNIQLSMESDVTSTIFANLSKFTYHNVTIYAATKFGRGLIPCIYRIRTKDDSK